MIITSLAGKWEFRQAGTDDWFSATVPGSVHTDLLTSGLIPDPFVADHEKDVQWVAEQDWEYRLHFDCSTDLFAAERIYLVCDGLDTLATVTLNGRLLGRTENMFRQYRWDVSSVLSSQDNELLIQFASPIRYITQKQAIRPLPGVSQAIPGSPYLRKAPYQFGWDWAPQLPPIGIWKDLRLEGYNLARLEEVHLRQDHHAFGQVSVVAKIAVEKWQDVLVTASMRITTPDGEILQSNTQISEEDEALIRLEIPDPELWWPNGYGEQPLYQVEIAIYSGDMEHTSSLDQRTYQLGLRTIELRQEEDAWGRSFEFVVNGVPVFAKGSNWIPADSFPTRISDEQLEKLIRSAAETHQNMLRVWGGGFYEDERFYNLCDRYGILVWQEFIFSCSIYPLNDPAFLENVQSEVIQNVRRLRHRACLAIWCGNNEMEWGWQSWNWDRPELQDLKAAYDRFFHHTLPEWCQAEDPDRPYWPSSPSSHTPFEDPNGQRQGDTHYWDVWHGRKPFTAYRSQYPRFMSEFGFQSLPPLTTIGTYAQEDDLNLTSYIMEHHQKNPSGNGLMIAQMAEHFLMPKDFSSLVYLSMVLQAEGIRYGVEHWRRNRDRVAGTLYWQLNDCWPVASWSSVDYFGRWKALNYAARRFYAPILLSILDEPTGQSLYVTNDLRDHWNGALRWSLETLEGTALVSGEEQVDAAPLATTFIRSLDFAPHLSERNPRELVFVAELYHGSHRLALQIATFVPTKHLALRDPAIQARMRQQNGLLTIELVSRSLARLLEVSLDGVDVVFSDNYFDLPASRSVYISCPLPEGWSLDQAQRALRLRSIFDSYAHPAHGKTKNIQ